MKRRVILSLFAVALTALCATTAQAVVNVQLNLFYTDPADPNEGGTWDLLVQSGAANGVGGIQVILDGIFGVTGIDTDPNAIIPNPPVFVPATSIFRFFPTGVGTEVEVTAGDDLAGALITGVGTGAVDPNSPGNVAVDDLLNSVWDNSALIASGTFGATRPTIVGTPAANEFAPTATDPLVAAAIGLAKVRGDSFRDLGLEDPNGAGLQLGDSNRDGDVGPVDLGAVLGNWFVAPGALGWDDGDFNSDKDVGPVDLGAVLGNWFDNSFVPPAISASAVPEPSSLVLLALAGLGLNLRRKKKY